MEIKCNLCGKTEEILKTHKDYQRLANDCREVFICRNCSQKIQYQARQDQKPPKPI